MRDPMTWALPLFRVSGILVKLHLLYPLITLGLFLRFYLDSKGYISGADLFGFIVIIPFFVILLHEFGHCFAARAMGGSSDQILMWPLGGLAYVQLPDSPRAHFITTLCGPLVNVAICLACALLMLAGGFSPLKSLNPFGNPFTTPVHNMVDGRTYTSKYDSRFYKAGTAEAVLPTQVAIANDGSLLLREAPHERVETAAAPGWVVWTWRVCWISWWLFLFNMLIPAYPMDCGRLVHAVLWARTDQQSATVTTCYIGYGTAVIMFVVAIAANEGILFMLGFFIIIECYRALHAEQWADSSGLGYDFSQGYTSLEKDDASPAPRRGNVIKRWLQARQIRRLKMEHEQRIADEARMDELLDKIARLGGKHALTDEERRFMERVSERYRNRFT